MLSAMKNATKLALRMEIKYQVKNFLLDEPKLIIPASCVIRELRKTEHFREKPHPFSKQFIPDKNLKLGFATQKNVMAPNPHIIVPKRDSDLVNFMHDSVINKRVFAIELADHINRTWTMVQDETCLVQDFQMLLDTSGTLYNIDFDRCAEISETDLNNKTIIAGKLKAIHQNLQNMRSLVSKNMQGF